MSGFMCCRRRRTFNDLGHYESQFEAFATTRVHCAQSAAQIKDAQNLLSLFKFVYPALIALLSVAVIKLEWLHRLLWDYGGKWSYAAAALFVLIPMVTAIVLDRFLARRVTRLNKKGSDVAQKETKLLNEVATTLPMHQAVPLLAKYDATGTMVKKFVVADPEQTKRVESLIGDCRQLVHALGLAVATVHRMAPGGPTQAQEALAPIQPTLQKYKRELDPVLRSCGAAGLIDGPDLSERIIGFLTPQGKMNGGGGSRTSARLVVRDSERQVAAHGNTGGGSELAPAASALAAGDHSPSRVGADHSRARSASVAEGDADAAIRATPARAASRRDDCVSATGDADADGYGGHVGASTPGQRLPQTPTPPQDASSAADIDVDADIDGRDPRKTTVSSPTNGSGTATNSKVSKPKHGSTGTGIGPAAGKSGLRQRK